MRKAFVSCLVAFGGIASLASCSSDTSTPASTAGASGSTQSGGTAGMTTGGSTSAAAGGSTAGAGGSTAGAGGSTAGAAGSTNAGTGGGASGGAGVSGSGGGGSSGTAGSAGAGGSAGGGSCVPTTGKALQFNGDVADMVAGDLGADLPGKNTARTIELWAHYTSVKSWAGERTMLEQGRGGGNQVFAIDMAGHSGDATTGTGNWDPYTNGIGDNDPTPVTPMPVVAWNHLAWSYDGAGHFQFVVNGVKTTLPHPGTGTGTLNTTPGILILGGSVNEGTAGWDGVMDEVRVWSVSRTEADIKRDMKVKLKGTEPNLIAYYNLDEGTGMLADDIAKNAAHRLNFCTTASANAATGPCAVANAAAPAWVASDIPGPFTCAP
jgi:Concanavalin A-like lectin/glucanases superfamily